MLALCLMLSVTYYAQNYACIYIHIIGLGLKTVIREVKNNYIFVYLIKFAVTISSLIQMLQEWLQLWECIKCTTFLIFYIQQANTAGSTYKIISMTPKLRSLSIPLCTCWCLVLFVHCSVALYSGSALHGLSSLLITQAAFPFLYILGSVYWPLYELQYFALTLLVSSR